MKTPDWNKEQLTYREIGDPAMKVKTKEEATEYLQGYVDYLVKIWGKSKEEATTIAKSNIGYWTGYYDHETADRVMELFGCAHPVFGRSHPSPEKAFKAGMEMGKASR